MMKLARCIKVILRRWRYDYELCRSS